MTLSACFFPSGVREAQCLSCHRGDFPGVLCLGPAHFSHHPSTESGLPNRHIPQEWDCAGSKGSVCVCVCVCGMCLVRAGVKDSSSISLPSSSTCVVLQGILSFLSAPLLGALSDAWGRKSFLIVAVFFTCAPIPILLINAM